MVLAKLIATGTTLMIFIALGAFVYFMGKSPNFSTIIRVFARWDFSRRVGNLAGEEASNNALTTAADQANPGIDESMGSGKKQGYTYVIKTLFQVGAMVAKKVGAHLANVGPQPVPWR